MVSKLVLAYLTVFLAAGVSYALRGTAAAGLEGLNPDFITRMFRALKVDTSISMAHRYPSVPYEQRANLGVIPTNIVVSSFPFAGPSPRVHV